MNQCAGPGSRRSGFPGLFQDGTDDPVRKPEIGALQPIETAVRAEFEEHLSSFGHEKLPDGRQRLVRNGRLPERKILTGLGEVDVRVPKARSRSGSPEPFHSSVAPPYVRRCASLDAAIPWLYLHGVSTGQMRQAVAALVGERAARGLSANVVSRLKRSWDEEYRQWRRRRLDDEWVYLWADGLYSGLRGEGERLCVLVVIGVNTRGEKHFLAIEDGVRESTQSWREVLLAMKQRGFTRPAKLAVGDGAMGFWAALSEVFPSTRPQRCWVHKTGNVLNYLPKSGQAKARQGLHEIWGAETRAKAERAFDQWLERYQPRQVPQGRRLPGSRPRRAARVLRLPRRALDAPSNHQRHRIGLCHDPPPKLASQGLRHPKDHALDGLQDGSVRGEILAPAAWLPTPREGHRGSPVQRRHRGHRGPQSRRMNNPPYTRFDNSSGFRSWRTRRRRSGRQPCEPSTATGRTGQGRRRGRLRRAREPPRARRGPSRDRGWAGRSNFRAWWSRGCLRHNCLSSAGKPRPH